VSFASIYNHLGGKDGIAKALYDHIINEIDELVDDVVNEFDSPLKLLWNRANSEEQISDNRCC